MPGTRPANSCIPCTGRPFQSIASHAVLALLALAMAGCAGYQAKPVETATYKERAIVQTEGPITISAAVPDPEETLQLTGIDLYEQGIQPVWLEVTNNSGHPARVAHWSIDRDYFSPIEVAYMNRSGLSSKGQADMQRWFYDNRLLRHIPPGETTSGFVYTHATRGTKGFNVDVYGNRRGYNFTFFVPIAGFIADYMAVDFENLYPQELILRIDSDDAVSVYQLINDLAICCSMDKKGIRTGDPLNVVLIGSGLAVRRAMLRAGWSETAKNDPTTTRARENYYRGRPPDASFQQYRPDGVQHKELRLWLAPARVGEAWVWMAQVSSDVGAANRQSNFTDYHIDPNIDAARMFTAESFWYSQSVARLGVAGGVGAASQTEPRQNFSGEDYYTDGLRLVLWLSETPVAMDETVIENLLEIPLPRQEVEDR